MTMPATACKIGRLSPGLYGFRAQETLPVGVLQDVGGGVTCHGDGNALA